MLELNQRAADDDNAAEDVKLETNDEELIEVANILCGLSAPSIQDAQLLLNVRNDSFLCERIYKVEEDVRHLRKLFVENQKVDAAWVRVENAFHEMMDTLEQPGGVADNMVYYV